MRVDLASEPMPVRLDAVGHRPYKGARVPARSGRTSFFGHGPRRATIEDWTMTRRCELSGKSVLVGNNVSHANNKTKRRFLPNLQVTSVLSDALGVSVRLRLTPRAIRTIEHNGGIDAYVLDTNDGKLSPEMKVLKKRVRLATAKREKKAAAAAA